MLCNDIYYTHLLSGADGSQEVVGSHGSLLLMLFMMKNVMMAGLTLLWVESLFLSHKGYDCHTQIVMLSLQQLFLLLLWLISAMS